MIEVGALANAMNSNVIRDELLDGRARNLQEHAGKPLTKDKIKQISHEFESLFISQMLQHMIGESADGGMFGGGQTDEIYKSMMVDEYGKAIAKAGGIGIATHIERTLTERALLQLQEVGHADPNQ